MSKEEIRQKVMNFKSDQEILEFIKIRIRELEKNLTFERIGFGHKSVHNDYISSRTAYIAGHSNYGTDFPSLEFDDIKPYFVLIKELSEYKEYFNELYLFTPLMYEIFNYLSSDERKKNVEETAKKREELYLDTLQGNERTISIKKIHNEKLGLCGENAGLTHNIFKILGIDSQLVIGKRNNEEHAFNIIFPKGYGNNPAVLFDSSYMINFTNEFGNNYSLGYFKILTPEEYYNMISGNNTSINLESTANSLFRYYPILSGCTANYENANYCIGFERNLKIENGSNIPHKK